MPRCRVSYTDTEGIVHSVEVDADSLFEAVAFAVGEFRADQTMADTPGPMTEFVVAVHRPATEHRVRFKHVQDWSEPSTRGGPAAMMKRERVRKLIDPRQPGSSAL